MERKEALRSNKKVYKTETVNVENTRALAELTEKLASTVAQKQEVEQELVRSQEELQMAMSREAHMQNESPKRGTMTDDGI